MDILKSKYTLLPNPLINRDEERKKNWEKGEKEWKAYEIQREKERQNFLKQNRIEDDKKWNNYKK
jgi:hypothetical protein